MAYPFPLSLWERVSFMLPLPPGEGFMERRLKAASYMLPLPLGEGWGEGC